MTERYVIDLVARYPDITEIWLIGSRANGNHRLDSDWDYIAFGNQNVLCLLREEAAFDLPNIDLFVVYDGDKFIKPWTSEGKRKAGSLSGWEWSRVSDKDASYRATKARNGDDFNVEVSRAHARRVWP